MSSVRVDDARSETRRDEAETLPETLPEPARLELAAPEPAALEPAALEWPTSDDESGALTEKARLESPLATMPGSWSSDSSQLL